MLLYNRIREINGAWLCGSLFSAIFSFADLKILVLPDNLRLGDAQTELGAWLVNCPKL